MILLSIGHKFITGERTDAPAGGDPLACRLVPPSMVICFFAILTPVSFYFCVLGYAHEDMVLYGWGLFYGV
jgi:hypothetical protein